MRLILMRHAKSDWSTGAIRDHARPLNSRGVKSARALGSWLRQNAYLPDQALVSTATRTRQTMDLLGLDLSATFVDRLYHACPDTLLDLLQIATGETVLMIGHNPGIAEFAARIVSTPPAHSRFQDYPTGAVLVADFEVPTTDWGVVDWAKGNARDFTVPRDLM